MLLTIISNHEVTNKDLEIAKTMFFDFIPVNSGHTIGALDIETIAELDEISDAWKCRIIYDSQLKNVYLQN